MKKLYILSGMIALFAITSMAAMEPMEPMGPYQQLNVAFNANTDDYDWNAVFNILSSTKDSNIVNSYRDRYGKTLLCAAASTPNAPFVVTRLINDFKADPNIPDDMKLYPLSYSMYNRGQDIPKTIYTLVKLGADPYFKNNGGKDGNGYTMKDYAGYSQTPNVLLGAIARGLSEEQEEGEVEVEE